ncbi:hypothetical protein GJ842_05640 [Salmonella enterica]|uniref:Uncharacterized protein n=1 Tax=Salmonella enterica subsp. enterica serovar Java TaxID=224729 RepID=A0A6H2Y864_SALEB|nr:hypothetical protein [Salmonella enterica]ECW2471399.1 hypothetical protein [Salmonella enterica subsp. enterica serovar Java]EDV3184432.1 hypothetical protein [Salmonella enterica subsp. diarizonae]EIK6740081.1 hypothetical protein [Salmonella enterica subsp. enterica serovar Aqua]MCH5485662.1 hypothetical protein [Salmonella enterica subsp. diarizonae serovar 16:z10:e,n,x,z15]WGI48675.1 hypothetical protein QBX66_19155 [Salmonella enterica subsp. diarizonae serovar 48:i:z]
MALNQAEQEILERKTARWVYEQARGVTAKEVAKRFRLHEHTARLVIHAIMRRADGIRCQLVGKSVATAKGRKPVKYFYVIHLPDEYQPRGKGMDK